MSLQVWLPLAGDLHNQGLSDINITNSNATIDNNGKIGKCYYFNASAYLTENTYDWTNFNTSEFSLCCWYKEPSPVASGNSQIICIGTSSGWNNIRIGLLRRTSNGYPMFSVSDGSSAVQYNCTATTFSLDTWNHIACIYKNGEIKIYLNGILNKTYTTTITPILNSSQHLGIGAASNGAEKLTGYLNDVRIYDHCLSDKEVAEIAKGLVLHYKLDDPYIENSNIINSIINDTAYNSSLGKYGYNETSNLGKINGNFHGKDCVKIYTLTEGQTAQPYAYFSNLFTSNGTNAPAYKALSFDYFTTVPTTTWLNIYKLGSGSGTATWKTINSNGTFTGTYTNSSNSIIVKPNEWNHIEIVFHGTTDANAEWGYCINGPAHTTNSQYYFLYANIQVEENDHVTGYGNNFHNNIVYDSSGYNNNGDIKGILKTSNNTVRYNFSTIFDGDTAAIQTPNLTTMITDKNYTISCWTYKTQIGNKNYQTIYGGPSGFELEARSSSNTNPLFRIHNWGGGTTAYEFNKWYHFCFVHNDTESKLYINGELKITGSSANVPSGNYFIGSWSTSTSQNFDGNISDFRIYATALTAEQVLELYNTSASIDKNGNTYARELVEK